MHRDNFGRLFLVTIVFASVQLISCVPVDSSAFASERTRENKLAKKDLPIIPPQFKETLGKFPATYLDDLRLRSTSPERRALLTGFMTRENGRGPFIEPENDIPERAESSVLQKRIFYGGNGRRVSASFPDTNILERPGNEMLQTREDNAARELKALLSLRDRARAIHEKINDSIIKRYREGTKATVSEQNQPVQMRPAQEEPENDIPNQAESSVLQKRVFYGGTGRRDYTRYREGTKSTVREQNQPEQLRPAQEEPENDIPNQAESSVLQKRVFYGGTGRRDYTRYREGTKATMREQNQPEQLRPAQEEPENDIPNQAESSVLQKRVFYGGNGRRDSARYREGTKATMREQNQPEQLRPAQEWNRILHGFEED
ncbi:hypothetical protein ACROYT_G008025 [Oculina patagonica]